MVFAVCKLYSQGKLVGFRLIDEIRHKKIDIEYSKLYNLMLKNAKAVENLCIKDNEIVGVGGSLQRYTSYDINGYLLSKPSLVILTKIESDTIKYVISNYLGEVGYLSQERLLIEAEVYGLANAKVVEKAGKKFISAIDGEIKQVGQGYTENICNQLNKIYTVPRINSKQKVTFETNYKYTVISSDSSKKIEKYMDHIKLNPIYLAHLPVVYVKSAPNPNSIFIDISYNTSKSDLKQEYNIEYSGHAIYFNNESKLYMVVTQLNISNTKFLVKYKEDNLIVDDIIYIGSNWEAQLEVKKQTSNNMQTNNSSYHKNLVMLLGNVGLVIFNGADDVKTILYSTFNNKETLVNRLIKLGLSADIADLITPNMWKVIQYKKKSTPYITKILSLDDIFKVADEGYNIETLSEDILSIKILDEDEIGSINYQQIIADKYVKDTLKTELKTSLVEKEKMKSNVYNGILTFVNEGTPRYRGGSFIYYSNANSECRFVDTEFPIRYILYYILYKYNLIKNKDMLSWIDNKTRETIDKQMYGARISPEDKSKLEVILFSSKIVIDINDMIMKFDKDKQFRVEKEKRFKNLNLKSLLVDGLHVNSLGLIDDWGENSVVTLKPGMCGLLLTDDNQSKDITLIANEATEFEVISKINKRSYGNRAKITFELTNKNLELMDKINESVFGFKLNFKINCSDFKAEDFNKLFGIIICSNINNIAGIKVDGKEVTRHDLLYSGAYFFMLNIQKFFSYKNVQFRTYKFWEVTIELMKDTINEEEELKFLRTLISVAIKNRGKAIDKKVGLFKEILWFLVDENKAKELTNNMHQYLISKQK